MQRHGWRLRAAGVAVLSFACSSGFERGSSAGMGGDQSSGGANTAGVDTSGGSPTNGGKAGTAGSVGSTSGSGSMAGSAGAAGGGAAATGGDGGSSGEAGGALGNGGASGSAGAGPTTADGCPVTLEGFATLDGKGQNGTYGGRDGETVTVTTQADLNHYVTAAEPYVIRVQGKITISPKGTELKVASNKTIIGVGTTAEIDQGGFFLANGVHNVIIRNLTIGNTKVPSDTTGKEYDYDGVQMDTAHHVWIDHCVFHDVNDGMIDSRLDTTYVTTSWNILHDHNKTYGIGWTDNITAEMTIHHNIIKDTVQRNPSTDNVLRAHLFNNWLLRVSSYGNYARGGTNMVLENSVFDQVKDPYYYETGTLVATGNITRGTSGRKASTGDTYSFFDPNKLYEYTLDPAEDVEALLSKCAGPRAELGK